MSGIQLTCATSCEHGIFLPFKVYNKKPANTSHCNLQPDSSNSYSPVPRVLCNTFCSATSCRCSACWQPHHCWSPVMWLGWWIASEILSCRNLQLPRLLMKAFQRVFQSIQQSVQRERQQATGTTYRANTKYWSSVSDISGLSGVCFRSCRYRSKFIVVQ